MDEILIEEKKYISSKRAAKVTGYAKDYIGQLCREGRVPARLVGRNWYVLETAIHDHRFGQQEIEPVPIAKTEPPASEPLATWESPRYEASPVEALLPVYASANEPNEASQHLQDSWKEWFAHVADTAPVIPEVIPEKQQEKKDEGKEVNIPIRAMHHSHYQPPPEELLPRHRVEIKHISESGEEVPIQEPGRAGARMAMAIQVAGVSFALLVAVLAVIGSGYFDKYILSSNRASIISGIVFYNR